MKHANYITPIIGQTNTNRNGDPYLCKAILADGSAIMERIKDSWTLVAHGVQQYDDGTIEWDYSTGGHWTQSPGQNRKAARPRPNGQKDTRQNPCQQKGRIIRLEADDIKFKELRLLDSYRLVQLDREVGEIFFNTGQDPGPLIAAAHQLMQQYPGNIYAVLLGREIIWDSRETGTAVKYRLVRSLDRNIEFLMLPGKAPELLEKIGRHQAELYPDQVFKVVDDELNVIWTNEKSAPGKAEDTTKENG